MKSKDVSVQEDRLYLLCLYNTGLQINISSWHAQVSILVSLLFRTEQDELFVQLS